MQTDELIAAVRDQGGFDKTSLATSETVILSWLNARYRELVAESGFVKGVRDLGPTVADQAEYALPDSVVRVVRLKTDRGTALRSYAADGRLLWVGLTVSPLDGIAAAALPAAVGWF